MRSKILLIGVSLLLFAFQLPTALAVNDLYAFPNSAELNRFQKLTAQLRCLVCQNQTLADSNAPLANDLRTEIAAKISAGQEDDQIINYLVARYGNFILYRPPLAKSTSLLWFGPFALLIGSFATLFFVIKRGNKP